MSFPTTSKYGKRFLSNSNRMGVHDLSNEVTNPNGCQIDEVLKAGHGVAFLPDSLEQGHKKV